VELKFFKMKFICDIFVLLTVLPVNFFMWLCLQMWNNSCYGKSHNGFLICTSLARISLHTFLIFFLLHFVVTYSPCNMLELLYIYFFLLHFVVNFVGFLEPMIFRKNIVQCQMSPTFNQAKQSRSIWFTTCLNQFSQKKTCLKQLTKIYLKKTIKPRWMHTLLI